MNCKLFKVPYHFTDKNGIERTRYNLFLVFENGTIQTIVSNEYKSKSGNVYNNYDVLCALAQLVDSKDLLKYE